MIIGVTALNKNFRDNLGQECEVIPGFAQTVFQGALGGGNSGYFQSGQDSTQADFIRTRLEGIRNRVRLASCVLDSAAPTEDGPALVIGASQGEECLWLANQLGERCQQIIGTNLTEIEPFAGGISEGFNDLLNDKEHAANCESRIELCCDDIASSSLPTGHFTRAYSWQTFEHVMDPQAGIENLSRVLSPGGVGYIEYNPFFSIDGAHWPATIDIPWAHARMDDAEFERAVFSLHSDRQSDAVSFVNRAINRMAQNQMLDYIRCAQLEIVAFLPRVRTEDLLLLTPQIIEGVNALYPHATVSDLASRIVRVVVRKSITGTDTKSS